MHKEEENFIRVKSQYFKSKEGQKNNHKTEQNSLAKKQKYQQKAAIDEEKNFIRVDQKKYFQTIKKNKAQEQNSSEQQRQQGKKSGFKKNSKAEENIQSEGGSTPEGIIVKDKVNSGSNTPNLQSQAPGKPIVYIPDEIPNTPHENSLISSASARKSDKKIVQIPESSLKIQTQKKPQKNQERYSSKISKPQPQTHHKSVTEQKIYSHDLINSIMEKSKKKTVQHNINKIPNSLQLYAKPIEENESLTNTGQYQSACSRKIKEIHHRLSQEGDFCSRIKEFSQHNNKKVKRASSSEEQINKRVSLSGLVSHNFNSVNARRSLGQIAQPQEIKLDKEINRIKKRNSSSMDRHERIVNRRPQRHSQQAIQFRKAVVCDFHTPTDKFLHVLGRENQRKLYVYGENLDYLTCIKEYMQQEKVPYEQAEYIVKQIVKASKSKKQSQSKPQTNNYNMLDDEEQLLRRKKAQQKKRVMLKHLYFAD